MDLPTTALTFPAIDNHAHPLLKAEYRAQVPFEATISEASGPGLTVDATHTLACWRAAAQLARVFDLPETASWEDVKAKRDATDYDELCEMFMQLCGIQSLLLDDGLGGVSEWAEDWKWHRKFGCDTKRIVRVEIEAENVLLRLFKPHLQSSMDDTLASSIYQTFTSEFKECLERSCHDSEVVGFKSIACYRTGLNITCPIESIKLPCILGDVTSAFSIYKDKGSLRLTFRALNDWIVHTTLDIAGQFGKPVQFHTGLGDSDISLVYSSPAHMQPIIKAYPKTSFVLLHSSYPYTREAGYLTSAYENVFCDFGEVFPIVSAAGQRAIIRDVLDLCPANKILWSTDGHWFPESFYLGTIQSRQVLHDVLAEMVRSGDLTERQAVTVVENALFHNANRLYKLGLTPKWKSSTS